MAPPLPNIQRVILLMFENRSFDNVLGAFYPFSPDRGGVSSNWSNPLGFSCAGNGLAGPGWKRYSKPALSRSAGK